MGHLPIDGPDGSLAQLSPLPIERKIYIHMNNTNPILLEDSPERRVVDRTAAWRWPMDGLEVEVYAVHARTTMTAALAPDDFVEALRAHAGATTTSTRSTCG